jgi:hypothetical protein
MVELTGFVVVVLASPVVVVSLIPDDCQSDQTWVTEVVFEPSS